MEYFAGMDVSMSETHVCVVSQDGAVVHEVRAPSTPAGIAAALARVPACRRILFETGRMAPMLYHGLSQLGLPVVCVEKCADRAPTHAATAASGRVPISPLLPAMLARLPAPL
jgi:transposase